MSALADHLAGGLTTVCRAWVLTRADGTRFGFTDHDREVEVEGVTCFASSGLTAGALQQSTGLSVDNVEASGALSHVALTQEDLRAGRWDAAEVESYLVNWAEPEVFEVQFRGTLGEVTWADGTFSAELRGLAEGLNKVRGRVYQGRCDAVLGDGRCRQDLSGALFSVEVAVTAVVENRLLILPELASYAPKWFERGLVTVLSGPAEGLREQVKTDRAEDGARRIDLWASLRAEIRPGDEIRLVAGCDKRLETCRFKFNNLMNFRGFPHIPGEDWIMSYPSSRTNNTGGRR